MKKIVAGTLIRICLLLCVSTGASAQAITIDQAVQEALHNNLQLLAEKYNVTVAEAQLITARLRPNPIFSVGGDHLDFLGTGFDAVNAAGPAEYAVRTDFIFERGHKRDERIAVAQRAISVAELSVLEATRRLILDVELAVLDVLAAKATLALAEENLRSLDSVVQLNELRVRAGDLADVELVRTRLAALQYRNQVLQRQSDLRIARNRLQVLLGRSSASPLIDVTGDFRREALPLSAADLESRALSIRPDISGLRAEQARNQYELRLQLATGKADLVLGTEYRRQQGLNGTGNSLGLLMSVPLPIFDRNQGEIARVQRERLQLDARIRALEADIRNEVRTAYEQFTTARELVESVEDDLLMKARDVREITDYSYRRGEATLLEFLDAQRAFNDAMEMYYDVRSAYARSLYTIDSVIGTQP